MTNVQRKLTNNPANYQLNTAIIRFTEVSKGAFKSSMKHGGQTYFPRTFFRLIMNALRWQLKVSGRGMAVKGLASI